MKKLTLLTLAIISIYALGILFIRSTAHAQVTVTLAPAPKLQFFYANGQPLQGCKITTSISGTSTPLATYTDNTGTVQNQNPVTCDAGGFVSIWLIAGQVYRFTVADANFVQQYIVDGIVGIGGGSSGASANWSALLPGTNNNAGAFIATGNSWDFSGATSFKAAVSAGCVPSAPGQFCYDSTANKWVFVESGGPAGLANFALIGTCAANQFVNGLSTTAPSTCAQPSAANLSNGVTGSGAVVLAVSPALTGTPTINALNASVTVASGTATMTTALINSGFCGSLVTVSATGVATTDAIIWSPNASFSTNIVFGLVVNFYPTTNNVNFQWCNTAGGNQTPAAQTINWRVVR
jgi:hypothetical protein